MLSADLLNIHVEFDFFKGSAPTYTQPGAINSNQRASVMLAMPDVGPAVAIAKLGDNDATDGGRYTTNIFNLSGTVGVDFSVNNDLAMKAMGKNPGISKIQVRLNKTPIYEVDPKDVPSYKEVYRFDTTKYANGEYALDVVAFTKSGAISIPDYFEAAARAGDYYPLKININNATSGQVAIPVVPPGATASPTMPAMDNHAGMTMPASAAPTQAAKASNIPVASIPVSQVSASSKSLATDLPRSARIGLLAVFVYLIVGVLLSFGKGTKSARNLIRLSNIFLWPLRLFSRRLG
jgi:hypothetical protein